MVQMLDTRDGAFEARFEALLGMKRESSADVNDVVAKIIARVRAEGDSALIDFTKQFDRFDPAETGITVTDDDIQAALAAVDDDTVEALKLAHARILDHHRRQLPQSEAYTCLLYTSPSPRDGLLSRMPSSA